MQKTNDLLTTTIVIVAMALIGAFIILNSNRNQREIIEAVKQAHAARNATLEQIKQQMGDNEKWLKAQESLNNNSIK